MEADRLRTLQVFQGIHPDALDKLLDHASVVELDDEVLFEQGDDANDCLYVIVDGEISIEKDMRDSVQEVARLSEGEHFGEFGLLSGDPRMAAARAPGEATVLRIPDVALDVWRSKHPQALNRLYEHMFDIVAGRFRSLTQKAERTQFWL